MGTIKTLISLSLFCFPLSLQEIIRLQDAHHLSSLNTLRLLVRALFGDQQLESSSSFDTLKAIYLDHRPLFQEVCMDDTCASFLRVGSLNVSR
mgnify:CR=1 FL=1